MNTVILIGNVGKDPEFKTDNGKSRIRFSLATKEKYNDKERTDWHSIQSAGKPAEWMHRDIRKGSRVMIEGRLRTDSWDGTDGKKHYSTYVFALGYIVQAPREKDVPQDTDQTGDSW